MHLRLCIAVWTMLTERTIVACRMAGKMNTKDLAFTSTVSLAVFATVLVSRPLPLLAFFAAVLVTQIRSTSPRLGPLLSCLE